MAAHGAELKQWMGSALLQEHCPNSSSKHYRQCGLLQHRKKALLSDPIFHCHSPRGLRISILQFLVYTSDSVVLSVTNLHTLGDVYKNLRIHFLSPSHMTRILLGDGRHLTEACCL